MAAGRDAPDRFQVAQNRNARVTSPHRCQRWRPDRRRAQAAADLAVGTDSPAAEAGAREAAVAYVVILQVDEAPVVAHRAVDVDPEAQRRSRRTL